MKLFLRKPLSVYACMRIMLKIGRTDKEKLFFSQRLYFIYFMSLADMKKVTQHRLANQTGVVTVPRHNDRCNRVILEFLE